ncbi:MAG: ribosome silencing factor [Clostridia bacterium]|nr:ribosome silencing factor [Clostridia bacterium]
MGMVLKNAKTLAIWLFNIGAARVDLLDVRNKNQEFDYMVLSCTAQTQGAKLIAAELIKFATSNNIPLQHTEGQYKGDWIVLDFGEFVVHILTGNTRTRFHLDKLWKTTKNQIQYK